MGAAGYDQLGSRMKRTKSFRGVLHQSYTAGIIMNTASTFMSLLFAISYGSSLSIYPQNLWRFFGRRYP